MKKSPVRRSMATAAAVAAIAVSLTAVKSGLAAAQPGGFGDVVGDAYYAAPVTDLAARGVFAGTECDDGFCPSAPIDRKTMAVWTVRVIDGDDPPPVTGSRFDDVDATGFHGPFIERMAELEITSGCGDGSGFCPDRTVSRAQMATFISRAYKLPEGPAPGFVDVPADAWYSASVAMLAASGITAGCGDGSGFCPGRDTTRAQMAAFLYRAENRDADRAAPESFSIDSSPRGNDTLISASRGRTCAVRLDGGVACWGSDSLRERFALAGLQNVVAVSTGDSSGGELHACVLHADGTISCWGTGRSGQLGQGDTNNHNLPVTVPGISDAVAVSAGAWHTCAAHRDGDVTCWGDNSLSQLGDGTRRPSYSPQPVPGLSDAVTVAAGNNISCAVHRDGDVTCWGWPYTTEDGTTVLRRLSGPAAFTSVSIGWGYICATTVAGYVYCWPHGWTPAQAHRIAGLADVVAVSAGFDNVCALHRDGDVSCVGRNDAGEIGDGSTTDRDRPVRLAGITDAVAVSAAVGNPAVNPHACALHSDGSASCWGSNGSGQLGDGTTDNRLVPTKADRIATIPRDQAPATATELLHMWMEAIVAEREAQHPWLRVAWDHARDATAAVQSGFGGMVFHYCYASRRDFGCGVEDMHITEMSAGTAVHELLHVYDLHTGLAPSTAWGAVQLYFATTYPGCWSDSSIDGAEILADTVSYVVVPGAWLTYYNSPGCPTLPEFSEPTAEAEQVVKQGLAGQVPDWYRENITTGADLWAAWLRGPSLPALANLKDEFGGLCSTDWITYPLDRERFPPEGSNPFRDGDC